MIDAAYAIRHNAWATRRLLAHAATLTSAQLESTVSGTAGSVRYCLAHIVSADQRYLMRLGIQPSVPLRETDDADLATIAAAHEQNERAWERLLADPPDLDGWITVRDGRVRGPVLPAQAIHHGTDHRTQVGTILLHHGLELPDLDVWTYAAEIGDGEYQSR
jgi:uncharacterized damage-inducible protein DinB